MVSLDDLASYSFVGRSEADVREEWISPLLFHLGYGPGTVNRVVREQSVDLRKPMRRIGRFRYQVDYRPSVLNANLWILEAKPADDKDWDEHLSQAWAYATHPEIATPLMAVANGERLAVYDLTKPEWDEAEIDLLRDEIARRFAEVRAVLGAKQVSEFVRTRQLTRLEQALSAELDPSVADRTVKEVQAIADRVKPAILQNRRLVEEDQRRLDARVRERVRVASGVWGIAQALNQPFGYTMNDLFELEREIGLEAGPDLQVERFHQVLEAARLPQPTGPVRAFWGLRSIRLHLALRLRRSTEDTARLDEVVATTMATHLRGFDDPLLAVAHDLELKLPVLLARLSSGASGERVERLISDMRATFDAERWIREGLSPSQYALTDVLTRCRMVWSRLPWDLESIQGLDAVIGDALSDLPDTAGRRKLFGIAFDPSDLSWDGLACYTLVAVRADGSWEDVPHDCWPSVEAHLDAPGLTGPAARELLEQRDRATR